MVAAAAAWVRAARPELKPDQVAQVVRLSAHDLGAKGWDASTGFGLLDVGAALKRAAPRHDPSEPNDDVLWIDGRAFKRPDPFLSAHGHTAKLRALLDEYEDPADVYRVSVPPHARMRIVAKPGFGDVELGAFARSATSIDDGKALIAKSEHRGSAQEGVTVRSISNHAQTVYAAVAINPAAKGLDASYTLTIRRLRTRS